MLSLHLFLVGVVFVTLEGLVVLVLVFLLLLGLGTGTLRHLLVVSLARFAVLRWGNGSALICIIEFGSLQTKKRFSYD